MIYKQLGETGIEVSLIGFGAATLGNEYGQLETEAGKRAVHAAIDAGINYFDTSPYYGRTLSEKRLGEALIGHRDKAIIATKAGRYDAELPDGFNFSAERIMRSVEESLKRLHTDYIDVYQLHDIEFTHKSQILEDAIPAIQKLKQQGKVRAIGVTGYPVHLLRDVITEADLDMVLSYCHYNLMNTLMADVLVPTAQEKSMGLVNASTLHMGVLTEQGPQPWHPAPPTLRQAAQQAAQICRENGTDIVTLALQFALSYEPVSTTLVGMRTEQEVQHNIDVLGTQPDADVLAQVQAVIAPVKDYVWPTGLPENHEPGA